MNLAAFKPTITLFVVTLAAALALGFVYNITLEPIERQKAKIETETVRLLLPATQETKAVPVVLPDSSVVKATTCYADGELIGYAITVSPKGYSGAVDVMVGFEPTGVITGIKVISHTETAGLGANATDPAFTNQYRGKTGPLKVTTVKGTHKADEIEAITSATITSRAVTNGVNDATAYFATYLATVE